MLVVYSSKPCVTQGFKESSKQLLVDWGRYEAVSRIEGDDFVNAAQFVPKKRRFTCHWDKNDNGKVDDKGELTSIDHILLAPELAKRVKSVKIINNYEPAGISDHFPMVVVLNTH